MPAAGDGAHRLRGYPAALQVFERQIEAATLCVFPHVAQDIRELERDAGFLRQLFGPGILVAEDADADQADHRGDQVAVAIKIGKGVVGAGLRLEVGRGALD